METAQYQQVVEKITNELFYQLRNGSANSSIVKLVTSVGANQYLVCHRDSFAQDILDNLSKEFPNLKIVIHLTPFNEWIISVSKSIPFIEVL